MRCGWFGVGVWSGVGLVEFRFDVVLLGRAWVGIWVYGIQGRSIGWAWGGSRVGEGLAGC